MFGLPIPSFMLQHMYRSGSLRNQEGGFEFAVHNPFMDATIVTVQELAVGGTTFGLSEVEFTQDGVTLPGTTVSAEDPVAFRKGDVVAIRVRGYRLEAGEHAVRLEVRTEEFGTLRIEVRDSIDA